MLEIVTKGFKAARTALTGKTELTEENIDEAVRQIRVSLLEGDVELGVARAFLERVKKRAIGEVVQLATEKSGKKLKTDPGEHFVLICHNELEKLMGPVEEAPIKFRRPITTIMMVGLQGTGKTTTCGKLARYLLDDKRRPMLVAADIYRPAAVEQLKILGAQLGVPVYAQPGLSPVQLCEDALREAKKKKRDVVIFDTAGRLAIDEELMHELDQIKAKTKPDNVYLVCDAMAGQDTVRTAAEFNRRLDINGFIMTKMDGDARGGAALSIKEITGKPIKFVGMGETLDRLERFRPEGLASRILGMGDVVGLMQDFEQVIDEKEAERDTKKLLRGDFTLEDFLKQLRLLQQVGSMREIYEKFPIFGDQLPEGAQLDDTMFVSMESIIQSMTPAERAKPQLIDDSRAKRIARGSGRKPEQVKDLVQRFGMMHTVMQNLASSPGLLGSLPGFKQLAQVRKLKGMNMADVLGDMGGMGGMMPKGMQLPPGMRLPKGMQLPPGMRLPPGMQMPSMPGMGMGGGMPGMPAGVPGMGDELGMGGMPMGLPPGMSPQQAAAMLRGIAPAGPRPLDAKQRQKLKDKRKAEKVARKKSRKR